MKDDFNQLNNLPLQMKNLPNWVLWKLVQKEERKKPTKIPFHANTLRACDVTNSDDWCSFEQALHSCHSNRSSFNGIGFCLAKSINLSFIDLDNCLNAQGIITSWAQEILEQLPPSYIEISQSGKGLHAFYLGELPGSGKKVNIEAGGPDAVLEMYDCDRYAAVTGNLYQDSGSELAEAQDAITALYEKYFKTDEEEELVIEGEIGNHLSDEELLKVMFASKNGKKIKALWDGDISNYRDDESSADMALLGHLTFWTNRDADRMESLFEQSALAKRQKWQKRSDYRRRSIREAIRRCKAGYQPSLSIQEVKRHIIVPKIITGAELRQKEFIPPTYVVPGLLTEGLGILAGKPKAGKSWLAFNLAVTVATGGFFFRRQLKQGKALYAALEDNERRLQDRLGKITKGDEPLDDLLLLDQLPRLHEGGLVYLKELIAANPEIRLIIIDTLQRIKPPAVSGKNAYEQDYEVLIPLQLLALEAKISIKVITHLRKQKADDKFDQITGTLGISGAADTMWVLQRDRNQNQGILSVTGRDIEEQELALTFDEDTCTWKSHGNAHIHYASEERRKIHEFLKQHGQAATPQEVADALEASVGSLRHLMPKMVDEGFLIKISRGLYEAVIQEDEQDVY